MKTFAIMGGAGSMGRIIARDLVEFLPPEDKVLIVDSHLEKAEEVARNLGGSNRVMPARVNVRNTQEASRVLRGTYVLVNSAPYSLNLEVMKVALEVGAHYIDLGGLFHMTRSQLELHSSFEKRELSALLGVGAAPGISNLLARWACDRLETVRDIHVRVANVDKTRYKHLQILPISYSLQTILEEFSMSPAIFTRGKFKIVAPMSGANKHVFPAPIGLKYPMYTLHSEVATLPLTYSEKGVQEVSFKIAFDPLFMDRVLFLRDLGFASHTEIEVRGIEVKPIEVANQVVMNQSPSIPKGRLKQTEVVRTVVKGTEGKKRVTWICDCTNAGYARWRLGTDINTGCPPSIAAQMLAQGTIKNHGVLPPETAIEPELFFKELKRRRIWVRMRRLPHWKFPV